MLVRHWMTEQVEFARPGDDVASTRERLRTRRVRQFPVMDAGNLVGIVTDRDLRAVIDGTTTIGAVMTPNPVTTTPGALVEDAAAVLRARKIGALPVVEEGKLVGIVSESDLLAAMVELCRVLEPTTLIEVDCEEGAVPLQRIRRVLETRGGRVAWLVGTPTGGRGQRVALRVRMPLGRAPERILEEAGFPVLSCITGRSAETDQESGTTVT
jgi:acetoin utilization protein AcuB